MTAPRTVLLVTGDLFFVARVRTAARHLGVEIVTATPATVAAACRDARPARVLIDLHAAGALGAVRALRADAALAAIPVTGYYSHVDDALRRDALAAGVDQAMPRSAFTVKLASLLSGGE